MLEKITKMSLVKVEMIGFGRFKNKFTYEFNEDRSVIEGENRQGKTTIGESIVWAFLGCNLHGNDKADADLINEHSEQMSVKVEFMAQDGKVHTLERKKIKNTFIKLDGERIKNNQLLDFVGGTKHFLLMGFNQRYFVGLPSKEQRDFITSLLPEVSEDEILKSFSEVEYQAIENFVEEIEEDANGFLTQKRAEKREYEDTKTRLEGRLEAFSETSEPGTKKTFDGKEKLDKLESKLEGIYKSKPDHKDVDQKIADLTEKGSNLRVEYDTLKAKEPKILDTSNLYKSLSLLERQKSKLDNNKDEGKSEKVRQLEVELTQLRQLYKKQSELPLNKGDDCPTCSTTIEDQQMNGIKRKIKAELAEIKKKADLTKEQIEKLTKEEEERKTISDKKVKEEKERLEKEIESTQSQIKEQEEKNENEKKNFQQDKKEKLDKLKKEMITLGEEIKVLKGKKEKSEKDFNENNQEAIKEIKEKIEELKKEKEEVDKHNMNVDLLLKQAEKQAKQKNNTEDDLKKVEKKMFELTLLIDAAKKYNEVKSELLSKEIKASFNSVSINLQKLIKSTGELKNTFEVLYDNRRYHQLSNSEGTCLGLEMYDFVLKYTGLQYPLFLDDKESITKYETQAHQVIEAKVEEGKYVDPRDSFVAKNESA